MVAGRAPEPLHGARRRSGVSLSFVCDPRTSFSFGRRGCLPSPRVRAWVAGSRQGCRKSPRTSAWSERAIRSSPGFLCDPRASFSLGRRGCLPSPSRASLGRWVSARLQEEPLSVRAEREGDQEFPWLFVRHSRILFAWKERWNMPGYPQWVRALTFPVSFYRVSPSGGPCPIR